MSVIKQIEISGTSPTTVDLGAIAENISYDNTDTGLSTNIQDALDDIIAQSGYAVCATQGATAAKEASITNFSLREGAKIAIKFTYENTAANPTLNISNTGAKALLFNGESAEDIIKEGSVFLINYNGTSYDLVGGGAGDDSFVGTQAEWSALSAAEKAKYNGKLVYIIDDYLPGGIIIQSTELYTLDKDNWDTNNSYSFESIYPATNYNLSVELCSSTTTEQQAAYTSAKLVSDVNYNKIIATGTVPTIDIDVMLTVTRKSVWSEGGEGHIIINSSGTEMETRRGLKFVGATITDDPTNDVTIIEIESSGTTIVQKPTVSVGSYTYNGSPQGPTITWATDMASNCVVTNATKIDAGTYTLTIALKNTSRMVWDDLTTADITYTYTIDKATSDITLSKNSITLNTTTLFDTVTISNDLGRTLSVSSSDTSIVTASLSGNTITINNVDQKTGSVTLMVAAAANTNYNESNKIISVSAEFKPALVSWSSGTDAQIKAMVDAYYDGVFTLSEIQSVWSVGDSRTITLSAMSATGVGESHRSQNVEMVILDFNHDTLTTAVGGKTKALITVQQKNCLRDATVADDGGSSNTEHGYMNSTDTNVNGWRGCARRTWCNDIYYNALPSGFKAMVKQANHITSTGNKQTTTETTADYCFLPSEWEIFGVKSYTAVQEGTQYSYYITAANRYKLPKWNSSSVSDGWWERSPRGSYAAHFCNVSNYGDGNANNASYARGLAPACCL